MKDVWSEASEHPAARQHLPGPVRHGYECHLGARIQTQATIVRDVVDEIAHANAAIEERGAQISLPVQPRVPLPRPVRNEAEVHACPLYVDPPRRAPAVLPSSVGAGEDLTVYGNGTQSRCFAHVLDTVHALLLLMDSEDATGRVFNVGCPTEIPIVELARRVIERSGSSSTVKFVPYEEAYGDGFEELGRRQPS